MSDDDDGDDDDDDDLLIYRIYCICTIKVYNRIWLLEDRPIKEQDRSIIQSYHWLVIDLHSMLIIIVNMFHHHPYYNHHPWSSSTSSSRSSSASSSASPWSSSVSSWSSSTLSWSWSTSTSSSWSSLLQDFIMASIHWTSVFPMIDAVGSFCCRCLYYLYILCFTVLNHNILVWLVWKLCYIMLQHTFLCWTILYNAGL